MSFSCPGDLDLGINDVSIESVGFNACALSS